MKRISAVFGALLALTLFSAKAQENAKTAKIEELLTLTNAEGMLQQVYDQTRAMARKQIDAIDGPNDAKVSAVEMMDKVMTQFQERLSWAHMKPEYVRLYGEVYSDEEVAGILAFYKSDAGRAFVTKMPLLMSKSMEMMQHHTADLIPEIQRIAKEAAEKSKDREPKK